MSLAAHKTSIRACSQDHRLSPCPNSASVIVIDGGSLVISENGPGLPAPVLPLPAKPLRSQAADAAKADKPRLRPTGRVIELAVTAGGAGYDDESPPLVSITAPLSSKGSSGARLDDRASMQSEPWRMGGRAAQATAVVRDGRVVAVVLTDEVSWLRSLHWRRMSPRPPQPSPSPVLSLPQSSPAQPIPAPIQSRPSAQST